MVGFHALLKPYALGLGLSGLLGALLCACHSPLEKFAHEAPPQKRYTLTGVHLIPIEPAGLLRDQTLIVEKGQIVAMGPRQQVKIPPETDILPVQGQYVLPGFADMHVHLAHERDLLLFLRHGITQVRNMAHSPTWAQVAGFPDVRRLREKVRQGELLGPAIFACGPILDGDPPQNGLNQAIARPEQAKEAVQNTAKAGFDCVKVYNRLSRENFDQIVETARAEKVPVMGHVPFAVGIDHALEVKMDSIEHLNAYVENFAGHYRIPADQLLAYGKKTATAGVFNCPTLVMWDQHPPPDDVEALGRDPRFEEIPPFLRQLWAWSIPELYKITYPGPPRDYPQALLELSKRMVKALDEADSPLLIGTDANLTGVHPGSTALREMELFAEAGVSPQRILTAATLNPARLIQQDHVQGSLAIGKKADLVVLKANPLADIRHVRQTQGVLVQGRWLSVAALDQMLKASAYGQVSKDPGAE
ncbi:MAG: amidohydrolase family protein [Candidatus Sericytochromatia bacterium]